MGGAEYERITAGGGDADLPERCEKALGSRWTIVLPTRLRAIAVCRTEPSARRRDLIVAMMGTLGIGGDKPIFSPLRLLRKR